MAEIQGKPLKRKQAPHATQPGPLLRRDDPRAVGTDNNTHPGNARRPWQRPLPRGVGGVQRHVGRRERLRFLRHVVPGHHLVRAPVPVLAEHSAGPHRLQSVPGHHRFEVNGENGPFRHHQQV